MSDEQEFEDFLKRRRPLFRRDVDDGLEPPSELDRIVLRQAREAIEGERPMRLFGMPRWAAPMAIAATLVLGLAVVFKSGVQPEDRVPEVRVENIAQRIDYPKVPAAPPASAPAPAEAVAPAAGASGAVVVDLASPATRVAHENLPRSASSGAPVATAGAPAPAGDAPVWRRDARSWQAEIERLRASGNAARADAEQAEFNRQFRAYAVSPDR